MGRQYVLHNSPRASRAAALSMRESAQESTMLQCVVLNRAGLCSAVSGGSVFKAAYPLISGIPLASFFLRNQRNS
jgi:hypothetical protein